MRLMYLKISIFERKPLKTHKYEEKMFASTPPPPPKFYHPKIYKTTCFDYHNSCQKKNIMNLYFPPHNSFHFVNKKKSKKKRLLRKKKLQQEV